MNERCLFRGKLIHILESNKKFDGLWVYGYLADEHYINSKEHSADMLVDPATIGQCTGLHAAKSCRGESEADRLVFVDDFVQEDTNIAIVKFGYYTANNNKSYLNEEAYGFYLEYISHPGVIDHVSDFGCQKIIGNIHDNPELQEVRE